MSRGSSFKKNNVGSRFTGYDSRNGIKIKVVDTETKWVLKLALKPVSEDPAKNVKFEIGKAMKFGISFFSNCSRNFKPIDNENC